MVIYFKSFPAKMVRLKGVQLCLLVTSICLAGECQVLVSIATLQLESDPLVVGLKKVEQADCPTANQLNLTINATLEKVAKNQFRLYNKVIATAMIQERIAKLAVIQLGRKRKQFVFLDMSVAESPVLQAALDRVRDTPRSDTVLVIQDSENHLLTWCCYVGHQFNLTATEQVSTEQESCCTEFIGSPEQYEHDYYHEEQCTPESVAGVQEFTAWRQTRTNQAGLILNITASLGWDNLLVLYETEFELQVNRLVELASLRTFRITVGNVNSKHFAKIVLEHFEKEPEINIVLMSSLDAAQQILQLTQALEPRMGKRISVTGLSRWLLFCEEGEVHPGSWILVSQFDNIALIRSTRQLKPEKQLQVGAGDLFVLSTLLYKTGRRELATVGTVRHDWSLHLYQDVFPNIKFGFNGRLFTITTTPWTPYVYRHEDKDGAVSFSGFCIDMVEQLGRTLNFTIRYTEPPDGYWGNDDGNGTWNGMVGQVVRHEVDMIVAPMGITEAREGVIDFTSPFFYDDSAVIFKKPDPNKSKWRTYIDIFRKEVLICIFITLLGSCMILFLLTRGEIRVYGKDRFVFSSSCTGCLLYLYGSMLAQGGRNLPNSIAGRMFLSAWWLFCLIMAGTYSGNLIAVLTVAKDKPPFQTLKEMAAQDEYRFGTLGNSMWSELFKTSPRPEFQAIHRKMENFYQDDPDIYHSNTTLHLEKVKRGGYAYIADKGLFSSWLASNCDLILLREKFFPGRYGIGLPNNSVYTKVFSDQVVKLYESGLLQLWVKKWWPQQTFCQGSLVTEARALSIIDMQSSFYVLAIGLSVAALVLMLDVAVRWLGGFLVFKQSLQHAEGIVISTQSMENSMTTSQPWFQIFRPKTR